MGTKPVCPTNASAWAKTGRQERYERLVLVTIAPASKSSLRAVLNPLHSPGSPIHHFIVSFIDPCQRATGVEAEHRATQQQPGGLAHSCSLRVAVPTREKMIRIGSLTCDARSIMMDKYISLRMYMRSMSNTCRRETKIAADNPEQLHQVNQVHQVHPIANACRRRKVISRYKRPVVGEQPNE